MELYPDRFWDVGIAEQHAVTSMAPLAKEGFIPFVAIYSTFLQRGFDQIVHDVCLMNLPVVFAIDRAGIVGADGETHQGQFDISMLRYLPNMTLFAPRDSKTLEYAVQFATNFQDGPCALRYPRGAFDELEFEATKFEYGKSQLLKQTTSKIAFIGYGAGVSKAIQTSKLIKEDVNIVSSNIDAGGGASVVYADTIADMAGIDDLANYGEYSGGPTTGETKFYAETLLDLMTREKDPQGRGKVMIIGGAIANFTDVAKTFTGIIQAFEVYADKMKAVDLKIYVRRGGPNYEKGLKDIKEAAHRLGLYIEVYGPETHVTDIVRMALEK